MRLRTLFRLFLLLAAVAPITTAKADSLIIGTDTLRLDLHWLDDTPLDELARNDRVFEKKFQALIHQPTAEGFVIYIDGDHEHHSYWRLIDDKLYLDHTIRKSDYSEIDFSGIFVRDHTGYYPATFYSGTLPISGIFYQDGTKPIFVFEEGRLTYTNWTYPSFPCPSPMLGDPLFLHFDYMQFAQFTDGLWTCWMRILPDPSGNPITIQPLIVAHKSGIIDASDAAKKRLKTAIADSLKTVDFICDVNFSRGSIQAVLKTFEIPRPILYRKEIRKNGRRLVGYENATGRPIVPFGKYARCHTPIISENRIGIVETDEGKFIAIDPIRVKSCSKSCFSPRYFRSKIYSGTVISSMSPETADRESPPSADCDTRNRPTSRSISPTSIGMLSKLLSTDPATLPVSDISPE